MNAKNHFVLLSLAILISAGCSSEQKISGMRAMLESDSSGELNAKVQVEGADGNELTGSLVYLTTPANEIKLLGFDASEGWYSSSIGGAVSGTYTITVRAYGGEATESMLIPHIVLASRPSISALIDASGNDGLSGGTLDKAKRISVAWAPVPGATAYILKGYSGLSAVVALSTAETQASIAEGTIAASGSCSFSVTAQYIAGDPILSDVDYYSASSAQGATVYCQIQ